MLLVVIEGALRKWFLPGIQQYLYFAKDLLIVALYALLIMRGAFKIPPVLRGTAIPVFAIVSAWIGLFAIFNPELPSLALGLVGFRSYFLYLGLMIAVPVLYRDTQDLVADLSKYLYLVFPVCLIALLQFNLPADHFLNRYSDEATGPAVATFGAGIDLWRVRVTSTFPYITGFTTYLSFVGVVILAWIAASRWRCSGYCLNYWLLAAVLGGMLMAGSRAPLLLIVASIGVFVVHALVRRELSGALIGRLFLGSAIVVLVSATLFGEALDAFMGRATAVTDVQARLETTFLTPFEFFLSQPLLGVGIGATHQAAPVLVKSLVPYYWLGTVDFEEEFERVFLEIGVLGFVAFYGLKVAVVAFAYKVMRAAHTDLLRAMALGALLFLGAHIVISTVFNTTAGVLYWATAGALVVIMRDSLNQQQIHRQRARDASRR